MVRILISLRSASQSDQWKSVFPQVFKWLSCVFQGLWAAPVYGTIIKNAASCIHFQCPLEKCCFTWGGVQVLSFVQWKDSVMPGSLRESCTLMAVSDRQLSVHKQKCTLGAHTHHLPLSSHQSLWLHWSNSCLMLGSLTPDLVFSRLTMLCHHSGKCIQFAHWSLHQDSYG